MPKSDTSDGSGHVLVIDVGTTNVRVATVRPDATIATFEQTPMAAQTPFPGMVEIDAAALADTVASMANAAIDAVGGVRSVGIANQRSSTIVWDRTTGEPIAPGIGWQDLRTIMECLTLAGESIRVAPNQSATKLAWLLDQHDPERRRDLCFGTLDSWIVWRLTEGRVHATDLTNAAVTGLMELDASGWADPMLERLRVPRAMMPALVDSSGVIGEATALTGRPPIAGIAGDQQASMIGQGCLRPGDAKATFGSGGFLNLFVGERRPEFAIRGEHGCYPIVASRLAGVLEWGVEAVMLTAGTNVEWLREDLAIIATAAESHDTASQCETSEGVVFVPALLGLGTPHWDYGARGTLLGLTRGSGRPQIVRAVLEGIAHRGADLLEAAQRDGAVEVELVRMDGAMSANPTFVQALADATQRRIETCAIPDATTLGAAFLAGAATGVWSSLAEIGSLWKPAAVYEPRRVLDRAQWHDAVERARRWIPDLSALDF